MVVLRATRGVGGKALEYSHSHRTLNPPLCALALGAIFAVAAGPVQCFAAKSGAIATLQPAVVDVSSSDGTADGLVVGSIDIPAPRSKVWQVLVDCARAPRIMVNLKVCEVLEGPVSPKGAQPGWDVRAHHIVWIGILPPMRSVFKSTYGTETSIRFERAEGSDLTDLEGEWRLEPMADGAWTHLTYRARFGFHPLVPSFLIRQSMATDFPHFLEKIRAEALNLP